MPEHNDHAFMTTDDDDDDDDDYDYDATSTTTDSSSNYSTIASDGLPHITAYSHTYHGSGRLLFPNDASEAHRLAIQHALFQLCLDGDLCDTKLPLDECDEPFEILDVGAGSGIWACDMAARYPQVEILGIDLSGALLPEDVPPNVTFEIADATEPWPEKAYSFIHIRNLVGGGVRDWHALLSSALAHLKPGGCLEFTEVCPRLFDADPDAGVGAACREYEARYREMSARLGVDFDPVPKVQRWLSEVGAEGVRERVDWLPVRSWGGDPIMRKKGEALADMIECGLENWALMLFGMCGWKEEDTRALLEEVKKEIQDPMLRSFAKVTFITARKPLLQMRTETGDNQAGTGNDVEDLGEK